MRSPAMRSPAMGRPRKPVQKTFALNDGEFRIVARLTGFRRICMVLAEHVPAAEAGDLVMMRAPALMADAAEILEVKHVETRDGKRSALALRLKGGPDTDENTREVEEDG